MDWWLIKHKAVIECHSEKLKFQDDRNQEAKIFGKRGNPALHLISATKLFKHSQNYQRIYDVKLNPIDKPSSRNKPKWLSAYADIFLEELTQLPPKQELDHAIDLILGAQLIAKRP